MLPMLENEILPHTSFINPNTLGNKFTRCGRWRKHNTIVEKLSEGMVSCERMMMEFIEWRCKSFAFGHP
jgi:hypothetical protein